MKKIFQAIAFGALLATFVLIIPALGYNNVAAQNGAGTQQPAQDPAKAEIYDRFIKNRKEHPDIAYQAAKEYLGKYANDNDQYVTYLQKWVASYEKGARELKLTQLIYTDKNYGEAFSTGKQVLSDNPENLKALMDLGFAGYSAVAVTKSDTYNAESIGYARRAIQMIEAGKVPDVATPNKWEPFKSKEDALAYLYYAVGALSLKTNPSDSLAAFIKSTQYESDLKKNAAQTYFLIATAYETGPYKTMSSDFTARFQGKPETDESKLALANLNQVIDRIIDAYARAVVAAGSDPKNAQNKADWMKRLTELYKFRHENSDAGLNAYVAGITNTPLPPPPTPITTLPTSTPASPGASGTGNGAGDGAASGTAPAQPAKPATTAPASTSKPAPASTTAKPRTAHARRP
jgi:hypothetical protein